eukprot:2650891-Pyramimonas_sp.AAC.1
MGLALRVGNPSVPRGAGRRQKSRGSAVVRGARATAGLATATTRQQPGAGVTSCVLAGGANPSSAESGAEVTPCLRAAGGNPPAAESGAGADPCVWAGG